MLLIRFVVVVLCVCDYGYDGDDVDAVVDGPKTRAREMFKTC